MKSLGILLVCAVLLGVPSACQMSRGPIRIAFVGPLSGHLADLGTAGRNGAQLAVEEINADGGAAGRPLELLARDDRNDPETVKVVDSELISGGVVAIIGHMTSSAVTPALPIINGAKILMLSPTVSSTQFSSQDDYFLRVYPTTHVLAETLAGHIITRTSLRRFSVIYDLSNKSYTESYYSHFRDHLLEGGASVVNVVKFDRTLRPVYASLAEQLLSGRPDGVLILASTLDTALLCQNIRKLSGSVQLFASEWSASDDLVTNGGSAVEGIRFLQTYDRDYPGQAFQKFRDAYRKRFGQLPSFAAMNAYECVKIIAEALNANPDPARLKETILGKRNFKGLQVQFSIDSNGDAVRPPFMITVKDGRFTRYEATSPGPAR